MVLSLTDLLNLSDTSNTLTVKGGGADAVEVATGEWTDEGVVFVEFSPTEQITPVLEHLASQLLPG